MTVSRHGIQNKLMHQGVVMVEIDIAYPHFEDYLIDRGHSKFNLHYENEVRRLIRYARDVLYPYAVEQYRTSVENNLPFTSYVLRQDYEVTYHTFPLLSLIIDVHEYSGGIHGNLNRIGNTWNLQLGSQMDMGDLFVMGYDYMDPILGYIQSEARRKSRAQEARYFDELWKNIREYADEKNFCVTYKGLAVFYQLHTIGAAGIQVFIIPYILFNSNLLFPRVWVVDLSSVPLKA